MIGVYRIGYYPGDGGQHSAGNVAKELRFRLYDVRRPLRTIAYGIDCLVRIPRAAFRRAREIQPRYVFGVEKIADRRVRKARKGSLASQLFARWSDQRRYRSLGGRLASPRARRRKIDHVIAFVADRRPRGDEVLMGREAIAALGRETYDRPERIGSPWTSTPEFGLDRRIGRRTYCGGCLAPFLSVSSTSSKPSIFPLSYSCWNAKC